MFMKLWVPLITPVINLPFHSRRILVPSAWHGSQSVDSGMRAEKKCCVVDRVAEW